MRKSIFLIVGLFTIAFLSGCEKHKNCYECTTVIYSVNEKKMTLCDVTEEEVEMFEQANTSSTAKTTCVKE